VVQQTEAASRPHLLSCLSQGAGGSDHTTPCFGTLVSRTETSLSTGLNSPPNQTRAQVAAVAEVKSKTNFTRFVFDQALRLPRRERIAAAIETAATNPVTTLCCRKTWRLLRLRDVPRPAANGRTSLDIVCKATKISKNTSPRPVSKLLNADISLPAGTSREETFDPILPKPGYNLLCKTKPIGNSVLLAPALPSLGVGTGPSTPAPSLVTPQDHIESSDSKHPNPPSLPGALTILRPLCRHSRPHQALLKRSLQTPKPSLLSYGQI